MNAKSPVSLDLQTHFFYFLLCFESRTRVTDRPILRSPRRYSYVCMLLGKTTLFLLFSSFVYSDFVKCFVSQFTYILAVLIYTQNYKKKNKENAIKANIAPVAQLHHLLTVCVLSSNVRLGMQPRTKLEEARFRDFECHHPQSDSVKFQYKKKENVLHKIFNN